jgi:hypothetical protein
MALASLLRRGESLRGLSSQRVAFVLFVVIALGSTSCALFYISSPALQSTVDQFTACKGRPAPWLALLNLADQQAKKTDGNAVLEEVTLETVSSPGAEQDPSSCLDISFRYVRSNGHVIEVLIRDTDPPDVLRTDPDEGFGTAPTHNDLALIQQVHDKIKIGPREVLSRTYAEGLAFSKSQGANVNISTISAYLGDVIVDPQGLPNWNIRYSAPSGSLLIHVSPEDGRILEKKER